MGAGLVLRVWWSWTAFVGGQPDPVPAFNNNWICFNDEILNMNIFGSLRAAWVGIYVLGNQTVDSFLWTMRTEFERSVLVFAITSVLSSVKYKISILSVLLWYVVNYFPDRMGFFVYGVLLGHLRARGVFEKIHNQQIGRIVAVISSSAKYLSACTSLTIICSHQCLRESYRQLVIPFPMEQRTGSRS
jgi:hypothetical protein